MSNLLKLTAITAALLACSAAQAITYSTAAIKSGAAPGATFSAVGGSLVIKNAWGVTGVGVSGGRTSDEIDINEKIIANFAQPAYVTGIQLTYLYDGPEFNDVQERAKITATFADLSTASYTLVAKYSSTYSWNGLGSILGPVSNTDVNGGFWTLTNPFGHQAIKSLSFTAVEGTCGNGACTNQSDYALRSITTAPIPEPETYALLLAGLGCVGFVVRRRKVQA
jgi:uncharacterized protein YraI